MSAFADLLRRHREAKRWSQERLAFEACIDHSLVSRIERDQRNATRVSIAALAYALGLDDSQRDRLYLEAGFTPPGIDTELLARLVAFIREARAPADAQRAA